MKNIFLCLIIFFTKINNTISNDRQDYKACEFIKVELIDTVIGYSNMVQNYNLKQALEIIDRKYKLALIYDSICKEILKD